VLADLVGFLGAMAIAASQYAVSPRLFLTGVYDFVTIADFATGLIKTVVFGLLIGVVSCHAGLGATGGTEGVGRATTRAVVASALGVLAADFVLTKLMLGWT
ncbi:MAG TPA: ABC transporter permease, partial [Polyangiaceae bacterium]|nr:ABC transporter permease [Polyangiaceae bacterium]